MSSSRRHSSRASHAASGIQLWWIGGAVVVAAGAVVGGLALFNWGASPSTPAAAADSAFPTPGFDDTELAIGSALAGDAKEAKDLPAAIAATRPMMADTTDQLDDGAARLALWASEHLTWSALAALPETSPALYRKDPVAERGKRLCGAGRIDVVRAERNLARRMQSDHPLPLPAPVAPPIADEADAGLLGASTATSLWDVPGGKVFFAIVRTGNPEAKPPRPADSDQVRPLVLSVIAAGSTGTLVDGDPVRVCGVLTGVNLSKDGSRPDELAHRIVGMFDLPENRTPRK